MKFLAALALPLYALDQATKAWIFTHYALVDTEQTRRLFPAILEKTAHLPEATAVVPDFFHIVHWANTGAAFSIGTGRNWLFVVISLGALIGLLVGWHRGAFTDRPSRWAVGLLIAGILGNVTDRLLHGYVVDFLLFDLHVRFADPWPAFNVADASICAAAGLFILAALLEGRGKKAAMEC